MPTKMYCLNTPLDFNLTFLFHFTEEEQEIINKDETLCCSTLRFLKQRRLAGKRTGARHMSIVIRIDTDVRPVRIMMRQ